MKKFFGAFKYVSFLIGSVLIISAIIEFAPSIPRSLRLAYLEANNIARHENVGKPQYGEAKWVNDYWFEQTNNVEARWEPYVYWNMRELHSGTINIDSLGRRRTVQKVSENAENAFLIYMLGGSTMWGWGVPDQHTIPSELAAIFDAENIEIRNLGENGYVNTQSYIQLLLALRRGERPDLVIVYDGYNDLLVPTFGYAAGWPHNETKRMAEFKLSLNEERWRTYQLALRLAYGRTLKHARRFSEWVSPAEESGLSREQIWRAAEEVFRIYEYNMKLFEDLGSRFDFQVVFFLQPIRGVNPESLPQPGQEATIFQAGYRIAHDQFSNQEILFFLDGAVAPDSFDYLDGVHLTHRGNETVARRIYTVIRQRNFLPLVTE